MYYVLYCEYPKDAAGGFMDIDDGIRIRGVRSWRIGQRIDVEVPNPIIVNVTPTGSYTGPPIEMSAGTLLLMSNRLVEALRAAGVDNIDCYPASLRNTKTGETYNYQSVNILGLVAAADLTKSEATIYDDSPAADVSFESVVLKNEALHGELLFRLAENTGTIMIHEKVRDKILERGITTLKFIRPENWVRL